MNASRPSVQIAALLRTWLLLDFFGDARRAGNAQGSSLTTTIFSQSFLAFVFAALLYPETPAIPFAAANLCLSTLLVAIGALGDEERPQRRAADEVLVATAPVTRWTVVIARSTHAAFHLVLVTVGLALPPAILLAFVSHRWTQVPAYVLAACCCSGLAVGGLATVRSLAVRLLGTARATLLQGTLRAAALGGGFVLFVLGLQQIGKDADALPIGRIGAELLPPYHAARVLADPAHEAWRIGAWAAVALALLVANVALLGAPASTKYRVPPHTLLGRLLAWVAGRGPCLGVAAFVATTMWRSAGFRARVLPLLGLPAGMVFLSLGDQDHDGGFVLTCLLLQLPAIYLPFLIAFLPRADQRDAGWVFAHAPGITMDLVRDATARALVTHVLVPVHAVAATLLLILHPSRADAVAATTFAFGTAVLAAFVMVRALPSVPFTDDREADGGLDLGGLLAGAVLLGALGTSFGAALPAAWRWPVAGLAIVAGGARLRRACPGGPGAPAFAPSVEPRRGAEPGAAERSEPGSAAAAEAAGGSAVPATATAAPRSPSLGRELRAVLVLYAALSVVPSLFGALFAP